MGNSTYIKNLLFESQVDDLIRNDAFIEKIAKKIMSNSNNKKNAEKYIKNMVYKCAESFVKSLYLKKEIYLNSIKD